MLQVDLGESDEQIAEYVKTQCFRFGPVMSVRIFRWSMPCALIEMAHGTPSAELAERYEGSAIGTSAFVYLVQKGGPPARNTMNW